MKKVKPAIFNMNDHAFKEVKYKISLELEVVEHTDLDGICPMIVSNSLNMFLNQFSDYITKRDMRLLSLEAEKTDRFERERKWIGKVVKGRYSKYEDDKPIYGVLEDIKDDCIPAFLVDGSWCYNVSPINEDQLAKEGDNNE